TIRADYLKQIINAYITGNSAVSASAVGQALASATDASAARAAISAVADDDPRLSDARTPTAHTHNLTDLNGSSLLGRQLAAANTAADARYLLSAEEADNPLTSYVWHDVLTFGDKLKY